MMFVFNIAILLSLITMAVGIGFVIWASRDNGKGASLANFFGCLVVIFALSSSICSSYYFVKYWNMGVFEIPTEANMIQSKVNKVIEDISSLIKRDQ